MSLGKIAEIISLQPIQTQAGPSQDAGRWRAGQTIELCFEGMAASEDHILAATGDGQQVLLSGLRGLAQGLSPGALLSLRVLSTTPRLELALLSAIAQVDSPEAQGGDIEHSAAMRLDQISMTRQVKTGPDAPAIANAWRGTAVRQVDQGASTGVLLEVQSAARLLAGGGAATLAYPAAATIEPGAERWPFAPLDFGLRRVSWAALESGDDTPSWKMPTDRKRRAWLAVFLEATLPLAGRIFLRLQLAAGTVQLDVYCDEEAVHVVRQLVSELIVAIGCAGLRVSACRLRRSADRYLGGAAAGTLDLHEAMAGFSSSLFRAAAEVALLLQSPALKERLSLSCQ